MHSQYLRASVAEFLYLVSIGSDDGREPFGWLCHSWPDLTRKAFTAGLILSGMIEGDIVVLT